MLTLWLNAVREFRGVLDESLFLYLKFETSKYLEFIAKYWGNLSLLFFLLKLHATLPCAAMFFKANLTFECIERFVYALANFVFLYVFITVHILTFPVCHTFFSEVIS